MPARSSGEHSQYICVSRENSLYICVHDLYVVGKQYECNEQVFVSVATSVMNQLQSGAWSDQVCTVLCKVDFLGKQRNYQILNVD